MCSQPWLLVKFCVIIPTLLLIALVGKGVGVGHLWPFSDLGHGWVRVMLSMVISNLLASGKVAFSFLSTLCLLGSQVGANQSQQKTTLFQRRRTKRLLEHFWEKVTRRVLRRIVGRPASLIVKDLSGQNIGDENSNNEDSSNEDSSKEEKGDIPPIKVIHFFLDHHPTSLTKADVAQLRKDFNIPFSVKSCLQRIELQA